MHIYENHRIQTIFILLQAGLILGGSMLAGAIMKTMGYEESLSVQLPLVLQFVRNWGFTLILIPFGWTLITIGLEQKTDWHTKRWTIASGMMVLAALGYFLFSVMCRAASVTLMMSE